MSRGPSNPDALAPQPLRPADVADLVERTRRSSAELRPRNAQWMRRDGGGRFLPDDEELS